MTLKRKTTGLPAPSSRSGRKFRSRSERDQQATRIVLLVTGVIAAIVILILAVALLIDNVINPGHVVASAGGQNITVRDFQKQATYQRWRYGELLSQVPQQYRQQIFSPQQPGSPYQQFSDAYQQMSEPTLLGKSVLDDMTNQIVIEQYARANNISITDDDINKQYYSFFQYQPTPATATATTTSSMTPTPLLSPTPTQTPTLTPTVTQTLTPTLTPFPTGAPTSTPGPTEAFKNYQTARQKYLDDTYKSTGLSDADIRVFFTRQALRQKVKEQVTADVDKGNMEDQLKVRHILVADEQKAKDVLTALQNGESFASLAKSVSTDTGSGASGGELGWKGRNTYVQEFEDAIWSSSTKAGDILGPIKSQYGYHIIQVEDHATRPITDAERLDAQTRAFTKFVSDLKAKANPQTYDYIQYVPDSPSLADFSIQEGLAQGSSGLPGGFPGQ